MASRTVENERTKLRAAALDRASTSCFTVGLAAPVAGYMYGLSRPLEWAIVLIPAYWLAMAVILHLLAVETLKDLRE